MGMRRELLTVGTLGLLSACATRGAPAATAPAATASAATAPAATAPVEAYALTRTGTEAPGPNCPQGGSKIDIGQDQNANGSLDREEVTGGVFACNGPNGALVEASTLPTSDARCPHGGLEVRTGTDVNGNGQLDDGEFERNYSCNGSNDTLAKDGPH